MLCPNTLLRTYKKEKYNFFLQTKKVFKKILEECSYVLCGCQCKVVLPPETERSGHKVSEKKYFPLIAHGQLTAIIEKICLLSKSSKVDRCTAQLIRNFMKRKEKISTFAL